MKIETDLSMSSICHFVIANFSKLIQTHLFTFAFPLYIVSHSCTTPSQNHLNPSSTHAMNSENIVPFRYLDDGIIVIPVKVNDSITKDFILDTGIGITMISKTMCDQLKCKSTDTHTGKRMSGQTMTVPISSVKSISLGSLHVSDAPVGILDVEKFIPGSNIGGFLSLGFFRDTAFTVDYVNKNIILETAGSLKTIRSKSNILPVNLDIDGDSLVIFMPLVLPNGGQVSVEVDTGSKSLILNERFMAPLGLLPSDTHVRNREGIDETGHAFKRYFTKIPGRVHLPHNREIGINNIDVMFQKIIYDGLAGHYFLSQFLVTYNLPNSEMIFRIPITDPVGVIHARN